MNERDFQLIKRNQLDEDEKVKRANFIINTDQSLQETKKDVLILVKSDRNKII